MTLVRCRYPLLHRTSSCLHPNQRHENGLFNGFLPSDIQLFIFVQNSEIRGESTYRRTTTTKASIPRRRPRLHNTLRALEKRVVVVVWELSSLGGRLLYFLFFFFPSFFIFLPLTFLVHAYAMLLAVCFFCIYVMCLWCLLFLLFLFFF
ncbi:hypothetical protein BZA05DRAFT_182837 [Tricharina praecox]|uniref:uncharacterized protein n=1 Tax=Tricharina praecox TaxID=43433 RepID=UPI00221EDC17|nr:uncharacterized protein BZA05DRAFT_182837 [Tricharina praecox]KAI5843629.1 hypothetical protein BZA05DRAFT_182837 [Tricharina praecox]